MDAGQGFYMFCPFGKRNMVLLGRAMDGEWEEDAEEIAMCNVPQISSEPTETLSQPIIPTDTEVCTSNNIEELR